VAACLFVFAMDPGLPFLNFRSGDSICRSPSQTLLPHSRRVGRPAFIDSGDRQRFVERLPSSRAVILGGIAPEPAAVGAAA